VHLPHDPLRFGVHAFGSAVVIGHPRATAMWEGTAGQSAIAAYFDRLAQGRAAD
jgi:hypothetical protein